MSLKLFNSLCALVFIWWIDQLVIEAKLDIQFEKIDCKKSSIFDIGSIKVTKFNQTTNVVNGNMELKVDVGNEHEFTVEAARGINDKYINFPIEFKRMKICQFLNGSYREYQSFHKGKSNLPQVGPEGKCPLEKKKYYVKNAAIDPEYFPAATPAGRWRLSTIFYETGTNKQALYCSWYLKASRD